MVTFSLNKELDIQMASQFLDTTFGGVDFGRSVWEFHPELRDIKNTDIPSITQYFDQFYGQNTEKLAERARLFQREWNVVESDFIAETKRLFNGFKFPKGQYIGYVSSFNCNPRFLEDCTFQVFWQNSSPVSTTAHEVMHFIFYAYCRFAHGDLVRDLNPNQGLWWDVAEIFNNVILSTERFKKILKTDGDFGYPVHQALILEAEKLYRKSVSINEFLQKLFELR